MSHLGATIERPEIVDSGLPNKFIYPEFAGFAGEERLYDIVEAILPLALRRTWEIFERKHAYDNDCFQSLGTVARTARRTQRTVNRNIATFLARGLLVLRSEYKIFRRPDGSLYKKAVVVKDFSGLYALAHEYYMWQYSEEYLAPEREYVEHIRHDPRLQAKLCRFEDYRRLLEHHRDPFAQVQEDRRFTEYREDSLFDGEKQVEDVESSLSSCNETKTFSKELPSTLSETSKKRINEKDYKDSLQGDSFDSDLNLKQEEGTDFTVRAYSQSRTCGAQGYMKRTNENVGDLPSPYESQTNPVPLFFNSALPAAGKTCEKEVKYTDMYNARKTMKVVEVAPPPPKSVLARSFIHEISGIFGDLNEKGSKTGIERNIEAFDLEPANVLLCLVRAYVVARDTRDGKIRYHRPDGAANRMPLFCSMFKKFAQALGPGSKWQYSWDQMLKDIAADDRLGLWLSEHQAVLAGNASSQRESPGEAFPPVSSEIEEPAGADTLTLEVPAEGWEQRDEAYVCAEYLADQLATAGYGGAVITVRLPKGGTRYQILLYPDQGLGYRLVCEEDVMAAVELARQGLLFADSNDEQTAAGD